MNANLELPLGFLLTIKEPKFLALTAQYISYGLVLAISFVISIFLARKLGPEAFGIYSTALSVGSILLIFYDFGFRNFILRETSKASVKFSDYRHALCWLSLRHSIYIASIFIFCGILFYPRSTHLILAISLCFFGVHIIQVISSSLKGGQKYIEDGLHVFAARVISAMFIYFVFIVERLNIETIFYAWGTGLILYGFFSKWTLFKPSENPPFSYLYSTLFPLFLIDMFLVLYLRTDIIFMQVLAVNKSQIGNYSAAIRIIEACLLITVPMRAILQVEMRKKTLNRPKTFIGLIVKLGVSVSVGAVAALLISLNASDIINLIYGDEYNFASIYLETLAWFLVPAMALVVVNEVIIAIELEKWHSMLLAAVCLSMISALYYVVVVFGVYGVLYLKVIGEGVLAVSTVFLVLITCALSIKKRGA